MPSRFLLWSAALRSAPSGLALLLALSAGALHAQTTTAPIEVRNAQGKPVVSALAWKAPAAARMQLRCRVIKHDIYYIFKYYNRKNL